MSKTLETAIKYYEKVIEINPNNETAYYNLGFICQKQNNLETAIKYYEKVIEINPNNERSYYGLGIIYHQKDQLEKAIDYYKKVIKIDPNNQLLMEIIKKYYISLGKTSEEIEDILALKNDKRIIINNKEN